MTITQHATEAVHRGENDLPWVELRDRSSMQVLQVRIEEALWIVRTRFPAGYVTQRHRHTGPVWGYTIRGAWKYKEYDYVNRAGSFLYEPAGSVHTLTVPAGTEGITDVWFQVYGANLNFDDDGEINSVTDASTVLSSYLRRCESQGLARPNVVVG